MKNSFKAGDRVLVYGYDSTATFNHGYKGAVDSVDDETVRVRLNRGYHARVWFGQCSKDEKDEKDDKSEKPAKRKKEKDEEGA